MHAPPNTTTRSIERTTTTSDYTFSKSGKAPNLCHFFICFTQTNKNIKEFIFSQQNNITSNKLVHKPNLLYKAQLHAQKGREDHESTNLNTYQNLSLYCIQQMAYRGKAVHDAIMKSPIDANMEDTEDTMLIETNQTKRTQETRKGSSSSKRKKNTELST